MVAAPCRSTEVAEAFLITAAVLGNRGCDQPDHGQCCGAAVSPVNGGAVLPPLPQFIHEHKSGISNRIERF